MTGAIDDPHQIDVHAEKILAHQIGIDEALIAILHELDRVVTVGIVEIADCQLMQIRLEGPVDLEGFLFGGCGLDVPEAVQQGRTGCQYAQPENQQRHHREYDPWHPGPPGSVSLAVRAGGVVHLSVSARAVAS